MNLENNTYNNNVILFYQSIILVSLSIVGFVLLFNGCDTIPLTLAGKRISPNVCYSPDKYTAVIQQSVFEMYDCSSLYPLHCAEYDPTVYCHDSRYSYLKPAECPYNYAYYKCARYETYYCYNNIITTLYDGNKTCTITITGLVKNTTTMYTGSPVDIYIDKKNICSFTNNYPKKHTAKIGFGLLMGVASYILIGVFCGCIIFSITKNDNMANVSNPISRSYV